MKIKRLTAALLVAFLIVTTLLFASLALHAPWIVAFAFVLVPGWGWIAKHKLRWL